MPSITILNQSVRSIGNLFSLNDLHKAAGSKPKHSPFRFTRNDQTMELIREIERSPDLVFTTQSDEVTRDNPNPKKVAMVTKRGGRNQGTWVCKELVYAYAMWISAKFHLEVIRAFDRMKTTETKKSITPTNPPRMRMLVSIEQGQVVSTQLVPSNCVVFDPSEIQQIIKEPGYFSVEDYRRIANTALEQLTKLANSTQR